MVSAPTNRIEQITDNLRQYQDRKSKMTFPRVVPTEQRKLGTAFYDANYHGAEELRARADGPCSYFRMGRTTRALEAANTAAA